VPVLTVLPVCFTAYQDEGDEMLAAREDDNIPVDDEEEGEELFGDGMER
jgi:hypothetical protein